MSILGLEQAGAGRRRGPGRIECVAMPGARQLNPSFFPFYYLFRVFAFFSFIVTFLSPVERNATLDVLLVPQKINIELNYC